MTPAPQPARDSPAATSPSSSLSSPGRAPACTCCSSAAAPSRSRTPGRCRAASSPRASRWTTPPSASWTTRPASRTSSWSSSTRSATWTAAAPSPPPTSPSSTHAAPPPLLPPRAPPPPPPPPPSRLAPRLAAYRRPAAARLRQRPRDRLRSAPVAGQAGVLQRRLLAPAGGVHPFPAPARLRGDSGAAAGQAELPQADALAGGHRGDGAHGHGGPPPPRPALRLPRAAAGRLLALPCAGGVDCRTPWGGAAEV